MSDSRDALSNLLEPRTGNFVRQTHKSTTDDEPEFSVTARGRIGRQPQMMLAFKKCSGEVEVLPYSLLRRIHSSDPDRGFIMLFADVQLTMEGQGLTQLFHYVCEHRALEIVEAERTVALAAAEDGAVTRITRVQPSVTPR